MAKSKTVLSRRYLFNLVTDYVNEARMLDGAHRAAVGTSAFDKPVCDLTKARDMLGDLIDNNKKLGNTGRTTVLALLTDAHSAFDKTKGAAIRSDAHYAVTHSLFRTIQRLESDNDAKAVRR